jgi:hypothetical protein
MREAGAQAARAARLVAHKAHHISRARLRTQRLDDSIATAACASAHEGSRWLLENLRLLRTAEKDTHELDRALRDYPTAADSSGVELPRAYLAAVAYLDAAQGRVSEEGLAAFLNGYQSVTELCMAEIWGFRPALQLVILERIGQARRELWPTLISSLRRIGETQWKDLFEASSIVHSTLARDPASAYAAMDYESRDMYRQVIVNLGKRSDRTEHEIAQTAIQLAELAASVSDGSRAAARRAHVGFYLIDKGLPALKSAIGYQPGFADRIRSLVLNFPNAFYLGGIELLVFVIVFAMLSGLDTLTPIFAGLALLLLPATQAAVDFMNNLTAFLLKPRALPKLDFSEGIPESCMTMVAVPTLLLNEAQVRDLVLDLEIRFLANRDHNLLFALVTDTPDSDRPMDERDKLAGLAKELIEGLNRRYRTGGRAPFYLFHRHRTFNPSEGRWMGWERKRGKLLDLNRLLRGGFDAFPEKTGDLSLLPKVKYVITLDTDTQLPRDSAARLVGAIAHPLNRAVIDRFTGVVVEGYGILQPRIGISVQSASRSRLAALYSGQTGFDIYTHATSDVYQDLFGEGIFTGKGIYEVDALRETLENRFPENALLSHDLIEGAYARAALVSDIELIDDYPSHFSAYSRRKHRWVRGDWQIMRWLNVTVPDRNGKIIPNPITLISRWKIADNLRRSLLEPSMLMLLLGGWFYLPGHAWFWTAATVAMLFIPVYSNLVFSILRAPWGRRAFTGWAKDTASAFIKGNFISLLALVFLFHQALLSLDAIARSVLRVFVTRRKLLEWETAAEAENAGRPKAKVDLYLEWTPWIAAAITAALWRVRPDALTAAAPVLALWFGSRAISGWLNRAPGSSHSGLNVEDQALLRDSAERIYRFFHEWSSPATRYLIPDSVSEDGDAELRLSPTNLGMLLNARIAAVHFGLLHIQDFAAQTLNTLDQMCALAKYRGHLFNWYDIKTLAILEPHFISTVDSGNLAAALWTLKQAALAFLSEPRAKRGINHAIAAQLLRISEICDRTVREMDFRFLYHRKKRALSVGFDVSANRLEASCYDLLASESRTACFVAIAKGDIPQEAWFHLGRRHTLYRGERVLVSWTGTIFEYLMPILWMEHYPETIMDQSSQAVVRVQREYARRKGVPWGISESACRNNGYLAFGIPELAMHQPDPKALVVAPYSTFLALEIDPAEAIKNLRRMEEFGWSGRYGFYESVDYTSAGGEPVRSWMAHHQGMSLLAACNALFNHPLHRYFHAEPHVRATELLLHERVPNAAAVETDADVKPAAKVSAAA